jgi:MinD-like ATPase involved in chromosome partitioning or flagellar assembly
VGRQSNLEVTELAVAAQGANRPITTGRRIAVVSVRGGAGKSTVSALLATTLAGLRPDPVLAIDADIEAGSLPLRLGPLGDGVRTGSDRGIDQASEFDRVTRGLRRTVTRVWLWRQAHAATLHRVGEAAAVDLLRDRQRYLSRFFAVLITDCGPGLRGAVNRVVIGDAHAIVVAGTATLDGVHGVDTALRHLAADGDRHLLGRCVVTITTTTASPLGVDLNDAVTLLQGYGVPVIVFPHDRQLALGGPIDIHRLSGGVRTASVRLAAAVMDRAVTAGAIG